MFGSPKGVSDWAIFGRLLKLHIQSASHIDAVVKGDHFLHVVSGRNKDIYSQLSTQINDTVERNRHILKSIIDVVVLCGQQNIALRGHTEQNSNFLALLNFHAKTDPVLATHLASAEKRAKYTSPTIQNELIELCANQIRSSLVNDCNASPFYAFLPDEATDCATMEEISICVRFVHTREDNKKVQVREEFLGFVQAESTTGQALAERFLETQQGYGLDIDRMRAQGYDGTANMTGIHKGVQAIIRHRVPDAVYVHCKAHSLNLAIGHSCKEPLVRNMLGTLQQIAFAFHYSAKRLLAFQECLSQDAAVRVEMERRAKLRTLCETRWASRADSLYTFRTAFPVVVQALESFAEGRDAKARGYASSILQFDFIIALCATEHVLSNTVALSTMLQGQSISLIEAAKESKVVISVLREERNDQAVWSELFERAKELAAGCEIEPSVPRISAIQRN